ncbi:hypothetical protein TSOC_008132 [Tetrabaena socialis]|uniref:BAR domain-containing protein n=1 Tax=Tetrabaena socialis TaxID=47790 RepID=A0A2J7ZZF5_9CHLO|nr:hypothetical protein TSOC_008132 [Tetrabaena socialis]|eukprot:PNH05628.1 hypothetical protein TSOC_008132 [Tetrabaena socialis]
MGHGWRRVMENVRQKVGAGDRAFKATSNSRNEAMFKETTDFCSHLRLLERDLRGIHREIEGRRNAAAAVGQPIGNIHYLRAAKFVNLKAILMSPLPRAYDEGQNGAVPCSEEPMLIGQGVAVDCLPQAAADLKARLEEEVIKPLRLWLTAYKVVSDRMEKLEALRLELDSRRRTVDTLGDKLERLHSIQANPQQKERHEQELEKVSQTLQHKQEKLTRTSNAYRDLEQTVFNSLNTLIKDTGVLRDYTGISMQLLQECYQKSHSAFSTATPLLEYNSTSENLFNQHSHYHNMEPTQSERGMIVRQLTERAQQPAPGRLNSGKDVAGGRGAVMYADAGLDEGGDAGGSYGIDQHQPGPGYPDVPPVSLPAGVMANPYQAAYQHGPSGRYMTSPAPSAWQTQPAQY